MNYEIYGDVGFDFSFNNTERDVLFGGSVIFTGKNRLSFEIGKRKKDFKNSLAGSSTQDRDFTGIIGNVSLLHSVSSDTDFSLKLSKDTRTAYITNTTYYTSKTLDATVSHKFTSKLKIQFSGSRSWQNYKGSIFGKN